MFTISDAVAINPLLAFSPPEPETGVAPWRRGDAPTGEITHLKKTTVNSPLKDTDVVEF